ncbi:hypothetical protein GUJ93_ZPchr0004g39594 [Zizania palustris]|uniref:Uncharacterized protein n=1 Tax=Zizania palustris TaxID=103762 RepID=A0A8J5RZ50_ZIZPA|nr:hypothetical protein GUJ93_ZPchr0004g39594 [Zizania palustris]
MQKTHARRALQNARKTTGSCATPPVALHACANALPPLHRSSAPPLLGFLSLENQPTLQAPTLRVVRRCRKPPDCLAVPLSGPSEPAPLVAGTTPVHLVQSSADTLPSPPQSPW